MSDTTESTNESPLKKIKAEPNTKGSDILISGTISNSSEIASSEITFAPTSNTFNEEKLPNPPLSQDNRLVPKCASPQHAHNSESAEKKPRRKPQCSKCGGEGHTAKNKLCPGHTTDVSVGAPPWTARKLIAERTGSSAVDDIFEFKYNNFGEGDLDGDVDLAEEEKGVLCQDEHTSNLLLPWEKCEFTDVMQVPSFTPPPREPSPLVPPSLSPIESFRCFFTDDICDKFIEASNSYGSLHTPRWLHPITLTEFRRFLAVILALGTMHYPSREDAWDNALLSLPILRSAMPLSRFNLILRAWHFEDYNCYTDEQLKQHRQNSPLWPAMTFMSMLTSRFQTMRHLAGQRLDVEEVCIPWDLERSRYPLTRRLPDRGMGSRGIRVGLGRYIKCFTLADGDSRYTHNMFLFEGSHLSSLPDGISPQLHPIQQLLLPLDLYHAKSHVVTTDCRHTSIEVLKFVKLTTKNEYMGAVEHGSSTVPTEVTSVLKGCRVTQKAGCCQMRVRVSEAPETFAYLSSWRGVGPTHVLTTLNSSLSSRECAVPSSEDASPNPMIWKPAVVDIYRSRGRGRGVGGSDEDQFSGPSPSLAPSSSHSPHLGLGLGTCSWLAQVFALALHAAVANSFVLYNNKRNGMNTITYYQFLSKLIEELAPPPIPVPIPSSVTQLNKRSRLAWQQDLRRCADVGLHNPVIDRDPVLEGGKVRNNRRSECIICRRKTTVRCHSCNAYVCVRLYHDHAAATCWQRFHTDVTFPPIPAAGDGARGRRAFTTIKLAEVSQEEDV